MGEAFCRRRKKKPPNWAALQEGGFRGKRYKNGQEKNCGRGILQEKKEEATKLGCWLQTLRAAGARVGKLQVVKPRLFYPIKN